MPNFQVTVRKPVMEFTLFGEKNIDSAVKIAVSIISFKPTYTAERVKGNTESGTFQLKADTLFGPVFDIKEI